MGGVLIAPAWMHPLLRDESVKTGQGMIGVRLYSLSGFLTAQTTHFPVTQNEVLFQYYRTLQGMLLRLHIYQSAAATLPFLESCLSLINDMKLFDISCDQLPLDTPSQVECALIIRALYPIDTGIELQKEGMQHLQNLHNVYIYPTYETINESFLLNQLEERGAIRIPFEQKIADQHFYHAINKRQEIEACAQYIIQHQIMAEDIHITLADTSVQPLLAQIFERYQIPFTLLQESRSSIMTKRCFALLSYYLQPDRQHLLQCLDHGLFQMEHIQAIHDYIVMFEKDIDRPFNHLQMMQEQGHIISAYDVTKLQALEERAALCQPYLLEKTNSIRYAIDYNTLFLATLKVLEESMQRPQERVVYIKLRDLLKELYPFIHNNEDLNFALSFIENIQENEGVQKLSGIIVTKLTQIIPYRKHHFMLGCTQKQYPAFPVKAGIFDESYYRKIPYPTMEKRYQLHLEQLMNIRQIAEHVYVSYPVGTYDGKSQEAALEIEQWINTASSPYPLMQQNTPYRVSFQLSKTYANQLFLKDGALLGSISALERYVKCPFSYFLRYGLGLHEPMAMGFSDSYMGTLSHYILESLVSEYGKAYTQVTADKIEQLINHEINAMCHIFINREAQLKSIQQRVQSSINQTLERLHDFEEHNHLQPWKQEEEFYYHIPVQEDLEMILHGFIDRIDADHQFACILDYKSSMKMLSETNVFAALQLQLITYAMVTRHLYHKDIIGTYYISLKNNNIPQAAGTLSRRKPVTYNPVGKEDVMDAWYKEHRLRGWTMHPHMAELDDTGTHIMGLRMNKDGFVTTSKMYNLNTIERWFTQMYQHIGKQIMNGHIACEPNEEACMFCSYQEVCRFKGFYTKKQLLIETDEDLYWKGEEDANLE